MTQAIDHVALLPAYLAAGTALLALLTDLAVARRAATLAVTAAGAATVAVAAWAVGTGPVRDTFCLADAPAACSFRADPTSALVATLFALLTLGVLGLSGYAVRGLPAGEYCFLLAASMTGGVVLGYSRDLITLVVALETLTLPLYALVGLRRRSVDSAQGAVTFFVVSVVSVAVTLLGAALLYAATGAVHLRALAAALADGVPGELTTLASAGAVLVLAGLVFKVAAVPFHAWAPATYDGAPLPIAAYLSTTSKLGGVVAVVYVVAIGLQPWLDVVGPALAGFAVLTMTVGNLVALRQRRMVRLLAWSSVAQAGYILAPLGAFAVGTGRTSDALALAVTATIAYAVFYVMIELAAFGSVVVLRGGAVMPAVSLASLDRSDVDGGEIEQYRGVARRSPWVAAAFTLALVGLAGLPPGLAGLFAKIVVVRSLLGGGAGWLAVIVALNAVIGLAYYLPVAVRLYGDRAAAEPAAVPAERVAGPGLRPGWGAPLWSGLALAATTVVAIVVGFAPQLVLDAAALVAG
ncbi:MAG: NADH-quinone oxidoreductase subunit N [Micromonosporaceae bacterium]|nr:NADH-quinone oxidoreductase subunit N [Micromonosporaceae bacterium]